MNRTTEAIIGAAIAVHRSLGPGLLESAYETCLGIESAHRNLPFERQIDCPLEYRGEIIDGAYRIDLLVQDQVIIEVKATDGLTAAHEAQLLTYLKLMDRRVGLLINFNVDVIKRGIRRLVSGFPNPRHPSAEPLRLRASAVDGTTPKNTAPRGE